VIQEPPTARPPQLALAAAKNSFFQHHGLHSIIVGNSALAA
jgi:hypothetical protein